MRPARYFSIIQLSNSRVCHIKIQSLPIFHKGPLYYGQNRQSGSVFPSLTVRKRKNRCIPCIYWGAAIFSVVSNYSNLFLPFAFFLDCSHFTFSYELVVCPETAGFMKVISNLFPPIQRDESLLLYPGEIHCFQSIQQFLTGISRIQFFLKITVDG